MLSKERFEQEVEKNMEIVRSSTGRKYDHYGIYSISVDGVVVYVGKSRNMLKRVAQHMTEIEYNNKKNMYAVLRSLRSSHSISFDVVITTKEDDDDLGWAEAFYIRQYSPCLNIQYPHLDDYHKYDYVRHAKTITPTEVEEIIRNQ